MTDKVPPVGPIIDITGYVNLNNIAKGRKAEILTAFGEYPVVALKNKAIIKNV